MERVHCFRNDVIPVVLGAHPEDYIAVAPERSYIHIGMMSSDKVFKLIYICLIFKFLIYIFYISRGF